MPTATAPIFRYNDARSTKAARENAATGNKDNISSSNNTNTTNDNGNDDDDDVDNKRKHKRKRLARPTLYDDDDSNVYDEETRTLNSNRKKQKTRNRKKKKNDDSGGVSLNALKYSILGRTIETNLDGTLADELEYLKNKHEEHKVETAANTNTKSEESANAKGIPDANGNTYTNSNANANAISSTTLRDLQKDLVCPICYEVLHDPISLACGHSYCKDCLVWWVSASSGKASSYSERREHHPQEANVEPPPPPPRKSHPKCPTCRAPVTSHNKDADQGGFFSFQVNTCLRACVMALFPKELEERCAARFSNQKGEGGGAHTGGYQLLLLGALQEKTRTIRKVVAATADANARAGMEAFSVQRTVAIDANDQRMRLALAFYGPIREVETTISTNTNTAASATATTTIHATLCLVELEEDEMEEGIPLVVRPETDHEEFLPRDSRFARSFVNMSKVSTSTMPAPSNASTIEDQQRKIPLCRKQLSVDGMVDFRTTLSASSRSSKSKRGFVFHHEETGVTLTLVLRLPGNNGDRNGGVEANSENDEEHGSDTDDSSKDNEFVYGVGENGVGDYEEDGFVVPDIDDDDDDDNTAEHDNPNDGDNDTASHDECCLCGNGGVLLVCDGGDHVEGCRRCFHLACVGLETVPSGDWICSACATKEGLIDADTDADTTTNNEGRKGYEFNPATLDENEEPSMERRRPSKRRVILESDEDEEGN